VRCALIKNQIFKFRVISDFRRQPVIAANNALHPRFIFFDGGTGHQAFSRFSTALVASSSESTAT
jgi:hypothetical protein